jgi:hypothetical protein
MPSQPQHEEIQFESVVELPKIFSEVRKTHVPVVQILLFNTEGQILTTDEDSGIRVILPDAKIRHPYGLRQIEDAAYVKYGISSVGELIGRTIIKAWPLPMLKMTPRAFLPMAFPIDQADGADLLLSPHSTEIWRTPEQALELLATDDINHGAAGSQRRDIVRLGIEAFQQLPAPMSQA